MEICYFSKSYKDKGSAGNKAKTDIEAIMEAKGYRNVGLKQHISSNKVTSFLVTLASVLKIPFSLRKGDVLIVQYPLKKYFSFVCNVAHWRGCKVVTIIHDLGSFRRKKLTPKEEIKRLDHSDCIIAHNESMKQWLLDHNSKAHIISLQVFDYLSSGKAMEQDPFSKPYVVLYAGALSEKKNSFLYKLGNYISNYRFSLYGGGFNVEMVKDHSEIFNYNGFVPSDQLITSAQGHFGLVWDGDSITENSGLLGEYLKYNNPHKTSLYIRCHLPIIIWGKAALAPFVEENKIGICVDSLEDLDRMLISISEEEYLEMRRNVISISEKMAKGWFILNAINQACECILQHQAH